MADKPNSSAKPSGRSLRGKLSDDFVEALQRKWQGCGDEVIDEIRRDNPALLARLVADLTPKEQIITEGNSFDGLSADELEQVLVQGMAQDIERAERQLRAARKLARKQAPGSEDPNPVNLRARAESAARREKLRSCPPPLTD